MDIYTTFPQGLRYSCDMDSCNGCCTLFEDIPVYEQEIKRVEALGYRDFYEKRSDGYYIKQPCKFLEGKLCLLHKKHGRESKFITCKKYPFSAVALKNGSVVVDVKWACPGVSLSKGREITPQLIKEEFLEGYEPAPVNIDEIVYFHNSSRQRIEWRALERLLFSISQELLREERSIYRNMLYLTGMVRLIGRTLGGVSPVDMEAIERVESSLRNTSELIDEAISATPVSMDMLGYVSTLTTLFEHSVNPMEAVEKLGISFGDGMVRFEDDMEGLFSQPMSQEASRLYTYYLCQSLRECLTKPWDFISTYFWSLGVIGFADYIARLDAWDTTEKVEEEQARKAIRIVDFLNKHFSDFRDFAYEVYPSLGMYYLQFFIAGIDSGLGGY